jgi:hypothetical protein
MLTIHLLKWQYFGLKKDQAPLILIRHCESMFLKNHIEADQIVSWLKEYFVSTASNFNTLLWSIVSFHMILELIWSVIFVGWQIDAVQEVSANSWGQQWAN